MIRQHKIVWNLGIIQKKNVYYNLKTYKNFTTSLKSFNLIPLSLHSNAGDLPKFALRYERVLDGILPKLHRPECYVLTWM